MRNSKVRDRIAGRRAGVMEDGKGGVVEDGEGERLVAWLDHLADVPAFQPKHDATADPIKTHRADEVCVYACVCVCARARA